MRCSYNLTSWAGILLLIGAAASLAAGADNPLAACTACHGAKGEGIPALNAPAIAGQQAAYLERQLRNFRNARRGAHPSDTAGAQMRALAATLADDAVKKLAADIAALPGTQVASPATGDLHKGSNLYNGKCGTCHGGKAEGNPVLNAPRLAGLDAAYIKRQFTHFRDGARGTNPQDTPGRQMAMIARTLSSERDLDDVIAFIHQLGRPK